MHLRNKKQQFQNSWSVTYRKQNYDALDDPHASYYFLNKSMRKHLKSLKKVYDSFILVDTEIRIIYLKEENTVYD